MDPISGFGQWSISQYRMAAILSCRIGRVLVRRALDATAAPFARSIDGRLAHHDLQTSHAAPTTSIDGDAE